MSECKKKRINNTKKGLIKDKEWVSKENNQVKPEEIKRF